MGVHLGHGTFLVSEFVSFITQLISLDYELPLVAISRVHHLTEHKLLVALATRGLIVAELLECK